jgi:hypothetical protein
MSSGRGSTLGKNTKGFINLREMIFPLMGGGGCDFIQVGFLYCTALHIVASAGGEYEGRMSRGFLLTMINHAVFPRVGDFIVEDEFS